MPDDKEPCECSWMDKAKAIALVLAAIPSTIAATVGIINHNKTQEIANHQETNTQLIDKAVQSSRGAEKAAQQTEAKVADVKVILMDK